MKRTNIGLFTLMVALGLCSNAVGMKRLNNVLGFASTAESFTDDENELASAIAGALFQALDPDNIVSPVKKQTHPLAHYCPLAQELVEKADVTDIIVKCKAGTRTIQVKQATTLLTAEQSNGLGHVVVELTTYPFHDLVQPLDLNDDDAIEEAEEKEAAILNLKRLGRKMPMLPASKGKYMFSIKLTITNWAGLTAFNFLSHPIFEEMNFDRLLKDLLVSVTYDDKIVLKKKNAKLSSEHPSITEFDNTTHVKPVINEETGELVNFPNLSLLAGEEHPHLQFLIDPYKECSMAWIPKNRKDAIVCTWEENTMLPEEFRDTTGQLWVYKKTNAQGEEAPGYYKTDDFDGDFDPAVTSSMESKQLSPKLPGQNFYFGALSVQPPTGPSNAYKR